MKKFFQSWLINTLSVLVAVSVLKNGIHCQGLVDLVVASLLLGILNAVLKPVILFLALPLVLITLGLIILVINALLLYFVGFLLRRHFFVDNFSSAFWGALIISVVSLVLNSLTGAGNSRVHVQRRGPPSDSDPPGGSGPVIDV